MAYGLGVGLVP